MGAANSKQAGEKLAVAIARGDVSGVRQFLDSLLTAQTRNTEESRLLRGLNLNDCRHCGQSPLHLAAKLGPASGDRGLEIFRMLLDFSRTPQSRPELDPNSVDDNNLTVLHYACQSRNPPFCTQFVEELLSRGADACIASPRGNTPLDLVRQKGCGSCVRTLESRVALWQGWVDHYEQTMLVLPTWKARWLVLLQDRRSNSGPSFLPRGGVNSVVQGFVNTVGNAPASRRCPTCDNPVSIPDFVPRFQCPRCNTEIAVPATLQLAMYECQRASSTMATVDMATPVVKQPLPQDHRQLEAVPMEDSSGASGNPFGLIKRALQNVASSSKSWGMTVKIYGTRREHLGELSVRLGSEGERKQLMDFLSNPVLLSNGVVKMDAYLAAVNGIVGTPQLALTGPSPPASSASVSPPPSGQHIPVVQARVVTQSPSHSSTAADFAAERVPSRLAEELFAHIDDPEPEPWTCSACTYRNKGLEAAFPYCCACETPRVVARPAPAVPPPAQTPEIRPEQAQAQRSTAEATVAAPPVVPARVVAASRPPPPPPAAVTPVSAPAAAVSQDAPLPPLTFPSNPPDEEPSNEVTDTPPLEEAATSTRPSKTSTADGAEEDDGMCAVCWEKPSDAAVIPCGHMCGCYGCLQDVRECPMCRGPKTSVIRIYRS